MEKIPTHRTRPRCLIADDHLIFSDALRLYLGTALEIVGVVPDGRALIDEAIRLRPEIIIADVGMPLLNGLDAARRIKELAPKVKFIFLTMRDDPNLAAAALELGPIAFVLKHSAGSELLQAIEQVLRGKSYLTPKVKAGDWVEAKARARQFSTEMTPRQKDIVQLLAEGKCMKEIAGILQLSKKTVEFHKHHIMVSFNFKSNADLVLFALNRGLIAPNPELQLKSQQSFPRAI
jgi:DNA-binding NarL/FixJ family response regulator